MKTAVKDVMTTRVVWVKKGATQPVPAGRTVAIVSNVASAGVLGSSREDDQPLWLVPVERLPACWLPSLR